MGVWVTHVISTVELAKEARVAVAVVHTYLEHIGLDLLSGIVFPPLHCFKPIYGVDLSGRKTASIALGWCTSPTFHPVTHRERQDGEKQQQRKVPHFFCKIVKNTCGLQFRILGVKSNGSRQHKRTQITETLRVFKGTALRLIF